MSRLVPLVEFPARLATAARACVDRPVPDGEWTVEQVVRHLVAVEIEVHQGRLRDVATLDRPEWSWTEPGPWTGEPALDLEGVLARFAAERETTLGMLRGLDDDGWARSGWHATLGDLDVAGLVQNAVDHDEEHLAGLVPERGSPDDTTDG